MSKTKSQAAVALGKQRWKGVSKADRTRFSLDGVAARLAKPETGGPWFDVSGLVKEFGRTPNFWRAAVREGRLASSRRPAGKHWVKGADALRFVRTEETPKKR